MSFPEEEQMAKMFHYAVSQGSQSDGASVNNFTQTNTFQNSSPLTQRYQMIKEIGQGGMGKVYQVHDNVLKRNLALKTILGSQNEQAQKRFLREAKAMAKLSHPNIIKVYDIGQNNDAIFFTMDFIPGQDLSEKCKNKKIPIRRAIDIMIQVCHAIDYAHQEGVLHRDLKPSNVMIDEKNKPYVMDFGLAKEREEKTKLSQTGAILGTPAYMPPEQALGERRKINEKSDVYSLGATLYELLTGRPPFIAENNHAVMLKILDHNPTAPSEVNRRIPRELDYICLKALEKEQKDRYQSAKLLATDLTNYLEGKPLIAKPVSTTEALWKWVKRNKKLSAIITTSIAIFLLTAITYFYQITQKNYRLEEQKEILEEQKEILEDQKETLEDQKETLEEQKKTLEDQKETLEKQKSQLAYANEEAQATVLKMLIQNQDYNQAEIRYQYYKKVESEVKDDERSNRDLDLIFRRQISPSSSINNLGQLIPVPSHYEMMDVRQPSWKMLALQTKKEDNTAILWDLDQNKVVAKLVHKDDRACAAFHPSKKIFASGDRSGNIVIWQENAQVKLKIKDSLVGIQFHPKQPFIICSSKTESILYNYKKQQVIRKWAMTRPQARHNSFRPNQSEIVLTGIHRNSFFIQDIKGNKKREVKHIDIKSLSFDQKGNRIAIGEVGQITLFYIAGKSIQRKSIQTAPGTVMGIAWSHDGRLLASLSPNRQVIVRDSANGRIVYTISNLDNSSTAIRFDERRRLGVWSSKGVRVYQLEKTLKKTLYIPELPMVKKEDQKWIKQRSFSGTIAQHMLKANTPFFNLAKPRIALSPDKQWLAFQIPFASVIYNLKKQRAWLLVKDDFNNSVFQFLFTADSKSLFVLRRGVLQVWDLAKSTWVLKHPIQADSICYYAPESLIGLTKNYGTSVIYRWNSSQLRLVGKIPTGYKVGSFFKKNEIIFSRDRLFEIWKFSPNQKPQSTFKKEFADVRFIDQLCIYRPFEIALGNRNGELFFFNWNKNVIVARQSANAPIEGISYNKLQNFFLIQRRSMTPMLTKNIKFHGLYPAALMDGYAATSSIASEDGKLLIAVIPGFKILVFENN